jgi:cell division protein FtsB
MGALTNTLKGSNSSTNTDLVKENENLKKRVSELEAEVAKLKKKK